MERNEPIILVGFMGTGKTTLGEYLAEKLQATFIDLDHYIVVNENRSIPEIFDQDDESHFRKLEHDYLKDCMHQYDIIATGGGIIESDTSLKLLESCQNVVWLDCDIDTIYHRVNTDSNRPNANGKTLDELKNLYCSRHSRYNEIAFIKVNTNQVIHDSYQEIMNQINANDQC
ncbi:shikimate kinase [Staphylococcus massiliensis]|uniref:shikimate kinase n=1 Tax=Staphylococcus massiliensis TaxID=555791 RepID=UPI001EE02200|nr:shikimate kinase [Staphylococcus massiliensis]MCG3401026.1 shikimate kinase [Staphylococcus massiliensis]